MLRWRLLSAAVILVLILALVAADFRIGPPGAWVLPLGAVVVLLATQEYLWLLENHPDRPAKWAVYASNGLIAVSAGLPIFWEFFDRYPPDCPLGRLGWPAAALAVGMTFAFAAEMRQYRQPGQSMTRIALAVLPMTYLGLPLGFFAALRAFGGNEVGMTALLSWLIVVKLADTGAYTVGRFLGRHKMTPLLSPKKTWEGALGGVALACVASWLVLTFLMPHLTGGSAQTPWWRAVIYGAALAVAGMIGDLAESLIKRDTQHKDSSRWLPGLGGVLDIIDSLLTTAPVAYLFWVAEIVG